MPGLIAYECEDTDHGFWSIRHKADRENDFTEVWKEYTPISVKNLSIKLIFTSIFAYDLLKYNWLKVNASNIIKHSATTTTIIIIIDVMVIFWC